jgi:hypothetical protein
VKMGIKTIAAWAAFVLGISALCLLRRHREPRGLTVRVPIGEYVVTSPLNSPDGMKELWRAIQERRKR